jgi:hypothetical protein
LHKLKFFVSKRNLQNPAPPRILMHFLSRIGVKSFRWKMVL